MKVQLQAWDVLGRGTYGTVYSCSVAQQQQQFLLEHHKLYACKEMRMDAICPKAWHQILCKEVFSIEHEDVSPRLHGLFFNQMLDTAYLLMDMSSCNLAQAQRRKTMSIDPVLVTRDILLQLRKLHGRNVAHRDIKPSNILISKDGRASLCDFGMALGPLEVSSTNKKICTITHRAPEILKGEKHGVAADLWSLAVQYLNFETSSSFMALQTTKLEETDQVLHIVLDCLLRRTYHRDSFGISHFLKGIGLSKTSLASFCMLLQLEPSPARRSCAEQLIESVLFKWDGFRFRKRIPVAADASSNSASGSLNFDVYASTSLYPSYIGNASGYLLTGQLRFTPSATLHHVQRENLLLHLFDYYQQCEKLNFATFVWTVDIFDRLWHPSAPTSLGPLYLQQLLTLSIYIYEQLGLDYTRLHSLEEIRNVFVPKADQIEVAKLSQLFFQALHTLQYSIASVRVSTIWTLKSKMPFLTETVKQNLLRAYVYWPDGSTSRDDFVTSSMGSGISQNLVSPKWDQAVQILKLL